mgnify:CR=1 FL=1|jgi:hypothetical protein
MSKSVRYERKITGTVAIKYLVKWYIYIRFGRIRIEHRQLLTVPIPLACLLHLFLVSGD